MCFFLINKDCIRLSCIDQLAFISDYFEICPFQKLRPGGLHYTLLYVCFFNLADYLFSFLAGNRETNVMTLIN